MQPTNNRTDNEMREAFERKAQLRKTLSEQLIRNRVQLAQRMATAQVAYQKGELEGEALEEFEIFVEVVRSPQITI